MQSIPEERRQFFRVQQEVIFDYKPVEAKTARDEEPEQALGDTSATELLCELRRIDKDLHTLAKALADKERLLGDYLHKLNGKIDTIVHHGLFSAGGRNQLTQVSMSEGGITFPCNRPLAVDDFLVLQIIFLPNYTPVIVFAQVNRCDAAGSQLLATATFYRLRDSDRQELAKQVLRAQISQRKRDQNTENTL